jgi:hypothetical protein
MISIHVFSLINCSATLETSNTITHTIHTFEKDKFSLSPSNDDERAAGDAR